jgi:hypothetical protein
MTQPPEYRSAPKSSASARRASRMIVIGAIALGLVAAVVAGLFYVDPQILARLTPTPTPACVQPTLTLGTAKFRIQSLARAADGSVTAPADTPDVAYWVDGTQPNYVFALSPAQNNLALKTTLKNGDKATIVWAYCGTEEYVVKAVESGKLDTAKLLDKPASGIAVFVQPGASAEGFVVSGGRPGAPAAETPSTGATGVQAELSFLDTTTAADGKTIKTGVTIRNTGKDVISLSTKDISLTPENGAALAPVSVEPALPREIKPGASETFSITFPRPDTDASVLRILDFSTDFRP